MEARAENLARDISGSIFSLPLKLGCLAAATGIALFYFVLAEWSYLFVLGPSKISVFWLPSGVVVFLFIFFRKEKRLWPCLATGLFIGEAYVVSQHQIGQLTAFLWGTSNVVLGLSAGLLSERFFYSTFSFRRVRDVFRFFLLVPLMVVPGALIAGVGTIMASAEAGYTWSALSWGVSDALGIIFVAPVLFSWSISRQKVTGSMAEGLFLVVTLGVFSMMTFYYPERSVLDRSYFSFLIFFAAWAAIRFGVRGASLVLVVIDLVEVGATLQGWGTFANNDLPAHSRLLTIQVLVANLSILMLILAAALEEQFVLRSRAETATRVRDDFISVASHELKTPLTALTMEIQILNNYIRTGKIKTVPAEKLNQLANISETEILRFGSLINDLLDVSRITSGKMILQKNEVSILDLVHEAARRLRPELEKSGSILTITGDSELKGFWDERRISQVVTNLLSNAIKYGYGRPIIIDANREANCAVIRIIDHGVGIDRDDQKRIFDRFERAVSAKEYSGLGLGLFIAREIIEAHEGSISLDSAPGQGTTFRVELPLFLYSAAQESGWKPAPHLDGQIYH